MKEDYVAKTKVHSSNSSYGCVYENVFIAGHALTNVQFLGNLGTK